MALLLVFFLFSTGARHVLSNSSFCSGRDDGDYPYISNCSKFYSCSGGITHLKECFHNTYWNQPLLRCEHECNQTHPDVHLETTLAPEQSTVTTTKAGRECGLQKTWTVLNHVITGCPLVTDKIVVSRVHCLNECIEQSSCNCVIYYKSNDVCSLLNCSGLTFNYVTNNATVSFCF